MLCSNAFLQREGFQVAAFQEAVVVHGAELSDAVRRNDAHEYEKYGQRPCVGTEQRRQPADRLVENGVAPQPPLRGKQQDGWQHGDARGVHTHGDERAGPAEISESGQARGRERKKRHGGRQAGERDGPQQPLPGQQDGVAPSQTVSCHRIPAGLDEMDAMVDPDADEQRWHSGSEQRQVTAQHAVRCQPPGDSRRNGQRHESGEPPDAINETEQQTDKDRCYRQRSLQVGVEPRLHVVHDRGCPGQTAGHPV